MELCTQPPPRGGEGWCEKPSDAGAAQVRVKKCIGSAASTPLIDEASVQWSTEKVTSKYKNVCLCILSLYKLSKCQKLADFLTYQSQDKL